MKKTLIKNVHVLTVNQTDEQFFGFAAFADGKIETLGQAEKTPAEKEFDEVIDGREGYLLPGMIDVHSHLGLYEDSLGFEGADGNEDTDPVTPHLRAIDGVNPMDRSFRETIEAGVTTVAVSPGSANPIGGQIAAIKTAGRRLDDMVLRAPLAIKFALGENPKSVYHEKDETPVTRMATAALIREQLYKAREYLARKDRAEGDPDEDAPDFDIKLEALVPLLRGEIDAHFHAHRADDIFTALRIAREFGLKPVIVHGTEAHLVADLLAGENVPVISGPYLTDRSKPELRALTERSPLLLHQAGIETAITVDHPELPLRLLPMAAQIAVKAGLSADAALRAVTAAPARIAGLGARIGSLAPGMDADAVLMDGHPMRFESRVSVVWIDGAQQYRRDE
ncbi:amidohydrolase [Agathobaculum sp. NTUH-O15-33]|uniref:amidohydrolase n=1 Tax=Agathobaculum sp. NTUH-O15-33 TaxID=3079302 RepID=UPI002958A99B|nr:amidohydrolase [Agathobaculum sp. NTUH-O15-33]WNX83152.1 amidohydrolase [Agathobaculum sp. NTUH-O15-33]